MVWSGNWRRRGSEYIGRARLVQQESTSCREPEKHTCSTEFRAGTLCTSVGDSSTAGRGHRVAGTDRLAQDSGGSRHTADLRSRKLKFLRAIDS